MAYRETLAVRSRLDATRDRLVAQATDVVAEHGWAGASVAAVAAAAGISAGSVYQHFPSKAALAVEVFRRASGREVEVLGAALAGSDDSPVARLVRGVELFARRAIRRRGLAHALLAAPAEEAVGAERLEFRRRYRALFAQVIAEGMAAGLLPPQDPQITAAALTGAIGEVLVDPLAAHAEADADALVAELTALSLRCAGAQAPADPSPSDPSPSDPSPSVPGSLNDEVKPPARLVGRG